MSLITYVVNPDQNKISVTLKVSKIIPLGGKDGNKRQVCIWGRGRDMGGDVLSRLLASKSTWLKLKGRLYCKLRCYKGKAETE